MVCIGSTHRPEACRPGARRIDSTHVVKHWFASQLLRAAEASWHAAPFLHLGRLSAICFACFACFACVRPPRRRVWLRASRCGVNEGDRKRSSLPVASPIFTAFAFARRCPRNQVHIVLLLRVLILRVVSFFVSSLSSFFAFVAYFSFLLSYSLLLI